MSNNSECKFASKKSCKALQTHYTQYKEPVCTLQAIVKGIPYVISKMKDCPIKTFPKFKNLLK